MSSATFTSPQLAPLNDDQPQISPLPVEPSPEPPSDLLYEVIDGQIKEKVLGFTEAEIATLIAELLGPFVRTHRLGRVIVEGLFQLDPDNKKSQRRPDVAFISQSRRPTSPPGISTAVCDLPPDLAIEVNSPTNTAEEVLRKIHDYFKAGVTRVWVVFPSEQEVYAYSAINQVQILTADQSLQDDTLLPGFTLPLATLFEIQAPAQSPDLGNS
jgi:Uma2 family endonuclease